MSTIRFKELIEDNKKAEEHNKKLEPYERYLYGFPEVYFCLSYGYKYNLINQMSYLLTLDDDDVEYLSKKYFKKDLDKEYQKELDNLNKRYAKV